MSQKLGWHDIKTALRKLKFEAPQTLQDTVLVGGAACIAYLQLTENPPHFTDAEQAYLLSKDLDFANLQEAPDIDIPIGTLQFGTRLHAEDYINTARVLKLVYEDGYELEIIIADPLELYKEKDAVAAKGNRPQDPVHKKILGAFLKQELRHEKAGSESRVFSNGELRILKTRCKTYAPEIVREFERS